MAEREKRTNKRRGALELAAFVSDNQSEQAIKHLVEEEVMTFTRVRHGTIRDAVKFVTSVKAPRLLIVDVGNSRMVLSDVDELMNAVEPSTVVLLMGELNDIGLFRDVTMLGVADYIVKPVTPELLRRTIALRMGDPTSARPRQRTGKVVAVTGARGGAGVSTFIANLGWMLSQKKGRRVALVDLDLQSGALPLLLGVQQSAGMLEALQNPHRIDDLFIDRTLVHHGDKLSMLADEEPYGEDTVFEPEALDLVLKILARRYHYVILDLPRMQGPVYRHVLNQAQLRVILATPTIPAVRDTTRTLKLIGRDAIGQRAMIILNHVTPSTRGDLAVKDVQKAIGRTIDFELPFVRQAAQADNAGDLISNGRNLYSQRMDQLIDDLSGRFVYRKPSILSRLFKRRG